MTREGQIDQEGTTVGRVLAAVARSATTRITNDVRILSKESVSYTLAWPLITDVAAALAVPIPLVVQAIDEGEKTRVLRVLRDGDELVAVRADPF